MTSCLTRFGHAEIQRSTVAVNSHVLYPQVVPPIVDRSRNLAFSDCSSYLWRGNVALGKDVGDNSFHVMVWLEPKYRRNEDRHMNMDTED